MDKFIVKSNITSNKLQVFVSRGSRHRSNHMQKIIPSDSIIYLYPVHTFIESILYMVCIGCCIVFMLEIYSFILSQFVHDLVEMLFNYLFLSQG